MKKKMILTICLLLGMMMVGNACAEASAPEALNRNQQAVYEAVKYCNDLPKNAQVLRAMEYMCKVEGEQLRLLLIETTQNPDLIAMFGRCAGIMLVDQDEGKVITYSNCVWPEEYNIQSREDALNMVFSCYLSHVEGYNPIIFADHEMTYPLTEEEMAAVNEALVQHFSR